MDVLPNTIYASEAFLPMPICAKHLPKNYVPFGDVTEAGCPFDEFCTKSVRHLPLTGAIGRVSIRRMRRARPERGVRIVPG
jgi:hypothetical protein